MSASQYTRWSMLKNLFIFQIKLAFDAIRDLLLSPVSFVCTLIDIVKQPDKTDSRFQQLMKLGQQTDSWLNLFAQHSSAADKRCEGDEPQSSNDGLGEPDKHWSTANADQLFDKIEKVLKEQHANGKLTAAAKQKIAQYIDMSQSQDKLADKSTAAVNKVPDKP